MKYINANDVLPAELLTMVQKYYQGGYLYIPGENYSKVTQQTDYKIELEKRNQHIYLKYLEGKTNEQLCHIYHLSESSIRRIISKEKRGNQEMKKIIEQLLPFWGIENRQLLQIYPTAWEVNHSYVIKIYDNKEQLERNIKISTILSDHSIPVAGIVLTTAGEKYIEHNNNYFLMSKKLQGNSVSEIKDKTNGWKMGCAIAQLHLAFIKCEKEVEFWNNSLLSEMKGWIRETLVNNNWNILNEKEYSKKVTLLENVYNYLPKQLIHRDVHFGNFLFSEGNLTGYIDFDLSQRNIRIFDICYFLTGLLAEETDNPFHKSEWLESVKAVISGYESIISLSEKEKNAIPCVMECIEILFIAWFIRIEDLKCANDSYKVFRFIENCENDMKILLDC